MIVMALLSLLGIGMLAGIFETSSNDSDPDPQPEPEPQPEPPIPGETYDILTGETIEGTAGDDIFRGQDISNTNLSGNAGNDVFDILGINNIISGGEGDDTITAGGDDPSGNTIYGDEGNDDISSRLSEAFGGDGDDIIRNIITTPDGYGRADGGLGDDTLIANVESEWSLVGFSAPVLTGGDGSHTFQIDLKAPDSVDQSSGQTSTLVNITDFVPGEDNLVINTQLSGLPNVTFDGLEIEENTAANFTEVLLKFSNPDDEELGSVDNHLEAMSAATRFQHAA